MSIEAATRHLARCPARWCSDRSGPSQARPWATPPGHRLPIPGVSDARIRPRGGREQRDRTPPRCPALPPRQRHRRQPRFPSRHREPPPRRPPSRASNSASAHRAANSPATGAKRLNFNRDLGTRFRRSAGLKKKSSCSRRKINAASESSETVRDHARFISSWTRSIFPWAD